MPERIVVAGRSSPTLGAALAAELGCRVAASEVRDFPDGEVYARLTDDVAGSHAVLVQATRTNADIVEALLWQDACHEAGAVKVTTVVPYFGYARQDQVFKRGEAVSARAVARALYSTANELVIVDPHKDHILDFFGGVSHKATAVPQLAAQLDDWGVDAILAPDKGARARAQEAAALLGLPHDHLEKTRLSATEVRMETKELDVAGKRVAIVDDMIASGGTMIMAAGQLKDNGAAAVFAACTHGVFTGGAVPKLLAGGIDKVLCTDTVEGADCAVVTAAPAVAGLLSP